jgi:hypothetical protein
MNVILNCYCSQIAEHDLIVNYQTYVVILLCSFSAILELQSHVCSDLKWVFAGGIGQTNVDPTLKLSCYAASPPEDEKRKALGENAQDDQP